MTFGETAIMQPSELGFLGRVIHGTNPRAWLKEIQQRVGEKIDFSLAVAD